MSFIQLYKNGAIHKSAIKGDTKPYTFVVKGQHSEKFESIADLVSEVDKRDIKARSKSGEEESKANSRSAKSDKKKARKTVVDRPSQEEDKAK